MSLKSVVNVTMAEQEAWSISGYANMVIDATGEKAAFIVQIPKTGTITHIGFRTATVTTSQSLTVGIQTLSSGNPSGSAYGSMVAGTQASVATNTYYEVALSTPATAVRGDIVAIVVEFTSTVGNVQIATLDENPNNLLPYTSLYTGSWAKDVRRPVTHLKYNDGTYPPINCWPAASISEISFNSGSTPDERGIKFKLPFAASISGINMRCAQSTSGIAKFILYGPDGSTILSSLTVAVADLYGTSNDPIKILFSTPITIKPNQFYRLTMQPQNTNNSWLYQFTVNSAAMLDSFFGGQNWHLTTRTDGGGWTDTPTTRPYMGLIFDKLHDGFLSDYLPF